MRESTKARVKITRIRLVGLIICTVLALATFLIVQFAVGKEKLGFAPVWMLFIVGFMSAGLLLLALSIRGARSLSLVVGGVSFVLGLAILLFCLQKYIPWFVTVIIVVALLLVLFLLAFVFKAPSLALEFDNDKDSGRKTYKERKDEEAARRQAEREAEKEKPLPEIKSFKD